jgi:monofunctional biosynthetic peptidoglycan transglycosylase
MAQTESKGCLHQIKKILLWIFVIQLVYIFLCKWVDPPITITQITNSFEGEGLKRDYIGYNEMGRNIKLAVMASEDQLFADHDGFDMKSIEKAIEYNEKHPQKTRGASTISQQTAKNVFLWQHGGFFRKGLEVYFTFMIEMIWGKERILETYLNVAEMGPGIFGVQAASRKYFKKDAANLTQREAAMIAACLPNPKKFSVVPTSRYVNKRATRIIQQMNNLSGDEEIESLLK